MDTKMTKAEALRGIRRAFSDLQAALLKNAPVMICRESGRLAAKVDYAWHVPDVWSPELVERALALFHQAAVQTKGSPSYDDISPLVDDFQNRLAGLEAAKGAVTRAEWD